MQNSIPNSSQISLTAGEDSRGIAVTDDQYVYIRVRRGLLACGANPSTTLPSGHLYLFKGTIEDVRRYAGTTVRWVIEVAHLICSPTGVGQVYIHTTCTPKYWYGRDRGTDWRQVHLDDPLLPGIYEFDSNVPIYLSRLSSRQSRSKTSSGSKSSASTFCQGITERDGRTCVVTNAPSSLDACHLIPKRMGTEGAKAVVTEFVGAQAAIHVHKFHPMIGVLLLSTLSERVDQYILGFYHNTGETYTLHNFDVTAQDIAFDGSGIPLYTNADLPRLHLHRVTLAVHGGPEALPPKGVFDWHYLQCVAKRFATQDYKELPGIYFPVYPFKTNDDDTDDEFELEDYDGIEPPYPTYQFDRFMAEQGRKQMLREHNEAVALWASRIPPGI